MAYVLIFLAVLAKNYFHLRACQKTKAS